MQDKSELSRAWDENYVMADQLGLSEQAAKDFANRETTKQVMSKLQEAGINGFVSGAIHSGQVNAYGVRNAKRIETYQNKSDSIERNDGKLAYEQTARNGFENADDIDLVLKGTPEESILKNGSHMENGKPKANVIYQTGEFEYLYRTEKNGWIDHVTVEELSHKKHDGRLFHNRHPFGKKKEMKLVT